MATKTVTVSKLAVTNLMKKLTFKVDKWDDAKMATKLKDLHITVDSDSAAEYVKDYKLDKEESKLLQLVLTSGEKGCTFILEEAKKSKAELAKDKASAEKLARLENSGKSSDKTSPKKPAAKKGKEKEEKPAKKKGPGVVSVIVSMYEAATKDKPITKEKILEKLVKQFGPKTEQNRPIAGMKNTVNASSTWMKTEKNRRVKTDGKGGWWLEDKK